ncbi:MAG: Rne/Rng family ribonuclease [Clostridia bacterium]|nr:Rne/Rng family ribonuclease [Clostridia bacterium]
MSGRRIYLDCYSPYYRAALIEDGKLAELILQDKENKACVGDIFAGRVEKILPTNIAFINIGENKPVFLQLNDKAEIENTRNIKPGQEIIVQVTKEAYDEKCAVVTTNISRAGTYCVAVKDNGEIGVSRKITDDNIRENLRAIAEKYVKPGYSIVMRTGCINGKYEEIEDEVKNSINILEEIENKGKYIKAPAIIYKEINPLNKVIRDLSYDNCRVIINDRNEYEKIKHEYENAEFYKGNLPLFMEYGIESQIEKLFNRKIWLDCGAYIVIDETEAMAVIDVNSGKSTKIKNNFKINKEAAVEIARQIRLRNLNGMIIIDFINMSDSSNNNELYKVLKAELNKDRIKTYIVGMTELGLMQLTRQKQRKPLSRYIYHKCPMCDGLGRVKDISFLADNINNKIISIAASTIYNYIKISSNSAVIEALKYGCNLIKKKYNVEIELNTIVTSKFDYYEIEKSRI